MSMIAKSSRNARDAPNHVVLMSQKYNLGRTATVNCAGTVTKEKKMAAYFVSTFNLSEGNYLGWGRADCQTGS